MPSEPVGYLITFRTYGTWLHGDERGSVNAEYRCFGANFVPPNRAWVGQSTRKMGRRAFQLCPSSRKLVEQTIERTCVLHNWTLHVVNARTEHVHLVVSAPLPPEPTMNSVKSWCTRRLREAGFIAPGIKPWSHHGSTIYLWDDHAVREATRYVAESQGE